MIETSTPSWKARAKAVFPFAYKAYLSIVRLRREIRTHIKVAKVNKQLWPEKFTLYPSGRTLIVNPRDSRVRRQILVSGGNYYRRNQFFCHLILSRLPVDLFVDVGANYGECTFSAPKDFRGRIVAIEANPAVADYLLKTKQAEAADNVEIHQNLASDKAGEQMEFYIDQQYSGTSSVVRPKMAESSRYKRVVQQTETVDRLLENTNPSTLFLKVDVEGHEPSVISGARSLLERTPNVVCFVEFDTEFLLRAGNDPVRILQGWKVSFDIWMVDRDETIKVADLNSPDFAGSQRFHTDIVMTKFSSDSVMSQWTEIQTAGNLKKLHAQLSPKTAH